MTRARKLLWINAAALVLSVALWIIAAFTGWLESVTFVSHVSMAALVLAAVSGIAAGEAAVEAEKPDN